MDGATCFDNRKGNRNELVPMEKCLTTVGWIANLGWRPEHYHYLRAMQTGCRSLRQDFPFDLAQ